MPASILLILMSMVDRDQALAHPWLRDAFHVTDHMVTEDKPLKDYLDARGR